MPKAMSSTAPGDVSLVQDPQRQLLISSACSTSAHCIGEMPPEMIQWGKRKDIMFAGGHEDLDWTMSSLFDAMGVSSNTTIVTATASRYR